VAGYCEHGNETSGTIKGGKFLDRVTISFSKELCSVEIVYNIINLISDNSQ
jgi:hypothetical protein